MSVGDWTPPFMFQGEAVTVQLGDPHSGAYAAFLDNVNSATDWDIAEAVAKRKLAPSPSVDRLLDAKDTLIESLHAEVLRLNLELSALKAKAPK